MIEPIEYSAKEGFFSNFGEASSHEWLEANGVGGWASSSITGAHTRRYHGLLIAAVTPPTRRMVLLSRLDETISIGGSKFELGCNQYPGAIHPRGHENLEKFTWNIFPSFEYQLENIRLKKTIVSVNGENTTLILYEVLEAPVTFKLDLQPFVIGRDYHSLMHANDFINRRGQFEDGVWSIRPYQKCPEIHLQVPGATFEEHPQWYYNVEYRREWERGGDAHEDLFSCGHFSLQLKQGDRVGVIASTLPPNGKDAFEMFEKEKQRRQSLLARVEAQDSFINHLVLSADQFIVRRGEKAKSVIAGYPWFTDWGRDTMIAFPGLCLLTKRFSDAKEILLEFCEYISEGMIPNCFPDGDGLPAYNTVDATLWFFVAIHEYLRDSHDEEFVKKVVYPRLLEIVEKHIGGTRFSIKMDEDNLLMAGDPYTQLTWMDAKVRGVAVTPRYGKAVEINALWYNALMITAELCEKYGDQEKASRYATLAGKVKKQFVKSFWSEENNCLLDFIACSNKEDEGAMSVVSDYIAKSGSAIRPNQVIALSLPFELLSSAKAKSILKVVSERLVTPFGLRTLDPQDPNYQGRYEGNGEARDHAYHQGTVWPWLSGAYVTAAIRYGSKEQIKKCGQLLDNYKKHLRQDGINSISEILDGDEPQRSAGCPFQAWSVAEVLRAAKIYQAASRADD